MSARTRLPFGKFFWSDYASDPALLVCSYAAQGLWMRMLCIAAAHEVPGYVAIAGKKLENAAIARLTGGTPDEVDRLIAELEENKVFSRDRRGWIYSRRMVRDAKAREEAKINGSKGGNPNLCKHKGKGKGVNPPVKGKSNPQSLEATSDTKVSGADAPADDEKKRAFDAARVLLTEDGTTASAAGGVIANWLKTSTPADLLAVLPGAETAQHKISWITKALQRLHAPDPGLAALYEAADAYAPANDVQPPRKKEKVGG